MKRTGILTFCLIAVMLSAQAQKIKKNSSSEERGSSYLGLGTGVNNISGFAGLTFEAPITPNFSAKIGAGLGAWGIKLAIAGKYYKVFPSSWSFGAGYSTASGVKDVEVDLTTQNNSTSQKIKMNFDRAHMLDLVIGKAWGDKIKFNIDFGYSIQVAGGTYAPVNKTTILSNDSKKIMDVISPHGLILGMGLAFKL